MLSPCPFKVSGCDRLLWPEASILQLLSAGSSGCRYKAQFEPSELLCRTCLRWVPFSQRLLAALDAAECRFDLCAAAQNAGVAPLPPLLQAHVRPRLCTEAAVNGTSPAAPAMQTAQESNGGYLSQDRAPVELDAAQRMPAAKLCDSADAGADAAWHAQQVRVRLWGQSFSLAALAELLNETGYELVQSMCAELVEEAGAGFAAQCVLALD